MIQQDFFMAFVPFVMIMRQQNIFCEWIIFSEVTDSFCEFIYLGSN